MRSTGWAEVEPEHVHTEPDDTRLRNSQLSRKEAPTIVAETSLSASACSSSSGIVYLSP